MNIRRYSLTIGVMSVYFCAVDYLYLYTPIALFKHLQDLQDLFTLIKNITY